MEKPESSPNLKQNHLFFHMGPGLHSQVEAQAFQKKYPHVVFLNQPLDVDFAGLVEWAVETIKESSKKVQGPLTLLGHSFGGQVIRGALPQVSDQVGEIRLLNSAFEPLDCFINLQEALTGLSVDASLLKNQSTNDKMQFIFEVAKNPKMGAAYWADPQAQEKYATLAGPFPALNIESFINIFSSFLDQPPSTDFIWEGPAKMIYSLSDSLISKEKVIRDWLQIYPQAELIPLSKQGHYAHFESPATADMFFTEK